MTDALTRVVGAQASGRPGGPPDPPGPPVPVLPPGDMALYDNDVPPLAGGEYHLQVRHTIQGAGLPSAPFAADQEIVVVAPQVALDPGAVQSTFPPDTASGTFADVLPHVVLTDPQLPWERALTDAAAVHRAPWLALLVFAAGELQGATNSPTRVTSTTVEVFLRPEVAVRKPTITLEADVAPTAPCTVIQVSTETFRAVTPRLSELPFLAHCRHVHVGDKPDPGSATSGLVSVVVANRFPAAPPAGSRPGSVASSIVHLVSLEGLDDLLVETPDFRGATSVALLSLAAFTFSTQAESGTDFRDLVAGLVADETRRDGSQNPEALRLRLRPRPAPVTPLAPASAAGAGASAAAGAEVLRRLEQGFVPLEYRTRSGEATVGWYRGPLTPIPTTPIAGAPAFATVDAALAYAPAFGVFDLSLAGAFATGRALAISDRLFGQALLDLRRRLHETADALLNKLVSDHFAATRIGEAVGAGSVNDELLAVLDHRLLADIGTVSTAAAGTPTPPIPSGPADRSDPPTNVDPRTHADPTTTLAAILEDPRAQSAILAGAEDDLVIVARWLSSLLLLGPVPFPSLVAAEAMLPVESLRFFWLDRSWLTALVDGALSIGVDSSRTGRYAALTRDLLHDRAWQAARRQRDGLAAGGRTPADDDTSITGLLLRSALVSGWPTLQVHATTSTGQPVPLLRSSRVAPTVLLCLFGGVPHEIEVAQPTEGLRFGTDDSGALALRNPVAGVGRPALGAPLPGAAPFDVIDLSGHQARQLRDTTHRVLNLAPDSPDGMLTTLTARLSAAVGSTVPALGPADLAVQLLASPDAVTFRAPPARQEPPDA